jgi:hypothetical protein
VVLRLEGVKYSQRVYVNGREVGQHVGGYEPVEYDVTPDIILAGPNELLVAARDWTSLIAPGAEVASRETSFEFASWVKDGILAPIGSHGSEVGIWQSVTLEARPQLYLEDVFVTTSVRRHTLRVQVTLRNAGAEQQQVEVSARLAKGGGGPQLAPRTISLGAGESQSVVLQAAWPDPRLWSPQDPHVYSLVVSAGADSIEVRFGFREFWTDADRLMLNGRPINLLATAAHPMPEYDGDPARAYALAKSAGCVAMRLHAQPWPSQWYDAADEVGMLLIWESALWCLSPNYAMTRDEFWRNAREHIAAQVKLRRNHPSIVIWSAENELLLCGGDAMPGVQEKVGGLADLIRELDPTRPVMFDGDGDPAGRADIINLHYPHEFPRWNLWPETAYWFDQRLPLDTYPGGEWRWDRRKPLYLGEFLWVPARELDASSVFFGDAAYPDVESYHRQAKAAAWEMQVIAARDAGVSGMCPWNLWEMGEFPNVGTEAHRRAYQPVAAFPVEAGNRVFAGSTVKRTFTVLNDSGVDRVLDLRWGLEPISLGTASWQAKGARSVPLPTAGRTRVTLSLSVPAIEAAVTPARFTIELWEKGQRLFSDSQDWKLYSRQALSGPVPHAPSRVAVYDPKGHTTRLLKQLGIACLPLSPDRAQAALRRVGVAVIGRDALPGRARGRMVVGRSDSFHQQLLRFAQGGGMILVFEQRDYPGSLIPLSLTKHDSTIAFARDLGHPILSGLETADLAHWLPDGVVGRREMLKPTWGGFRPLVDSGGPRGLETAGLAELRVGKGRMVLCQLDVTAKFGVDAIATKLVRNILSYAGTRARAPQMTGVVCDEATAEKLSAIGLHYQRLAAPLTKTKLAQCRQLLICNPQQAEGSEDDLREFVREGGRVLLHGVSPATAEIARSLLGQELVLHQGCDGWVKLADRTGAARGLSNQDLAWFSPLPPNPFASPSLSTDIASYVVARPYRTSGPATRVEAKEMRLSAAAGQMGPPEEGWAGLFSNGELATTVTIPRAGTHLLKVRARGTPAEGAYPRVVIILDGATAGSVTVSSAEWQTLETVVTLPGGEHSLRLMFANDMMTTTEDRNLWVDWVEWAPAKLEPTALTFHAEPGVLVSMRSGRGLWVTDQVRWEAAGANDDKAARYLATLLTNLGCEFEPQAGEMVPASEMRVEAALSQQTEEAVVLATAGILEKQIEFASDGQYLFALLASGTPLAGIYPRVEVRVDGMTVGAIQLQTEGWRTYQISAPVKAGLHTVGLAFVNDEWKPPEDRNLSVGRLTIRAQQPAA